MCYITASGYKRKEVRRLNRMKELREAKGLSKSAVAEAVGITVSAILKYEAGITQPSVYAAWKLARLYGVTIEEMMGYDGRKGDNCAGGNNQP